MAGLDRQPTVQELFVVKRGPLGMPTGIKGSPVLFSQVVARLRNLAAARETRMARAEVDAVLACPWWGLRVVAIKTIAAWGGASNKAWLIGQALRAQPDRVPGSKEHGWWGVETRAALHAVEAILDDNDANWALTLAHENSRAQSAFHAYAKRVRDDAFLAWLRAPLRTSRGLPRVRLVNMVGPHKTLPGYMTLMQAFAEEDCGKVAATARRWIDEARATPPSKAR